jgi:hypothetical protein
MSFSVPWGSFVGPVRRVYGYFRTGVRVEGQAVLCEDSHPMIYTEQTMGQRRPQHIDIEARLWNSRGGRVSILDVADARILSRTQWLDVASWHAFRPLTLDEGAQPEPSYFSLVPRDNPDARVEVALGEVVVVEFRPSRGSALLEQILRVVHVVRLAADYAVE